MPLTEKGETIKSAMKSQYGEEKGEEVFYASRNKGTISGVDSMSKEKLDSIVAKTDALVSRFDSMATKRRMRQDAIRKRMADARIAKDQKKLDGQVVEDATVDDEDAYDDDDDDDEHQFKDTQLDPGSLSKRNFETR